jgi:hypothetical protein
MYPSNNKKYKIHPAIIKSDKWGVELDRVEDNLHYAKFKNWALKKKRFIKDNYSVDAAESFLRILATEEIIPFFKGGMAFDLKELNKMVDTALIDPELPFLDQEVAARIFPLRESVTVISLGLHLAWQAKAEFSADEVKARTYVKKSKNIIDKTLPLLTKGHNAGIDYFEDIKDTMKAEYGDEISTEEQLTNLGELNQAIKTVITKRLSKGNLNEAVEATPE